MRIAVGSQNYRTVSGHGGRCRRFIIFEVDTGAAPREVERLDLPKQLSIREFSGDGPHPLDAVHAVIVSCAGPGAIGRLSARRVEVVTTSERDPAVAAAKYVAGNLPRDAHAAGPDYMTENDSAVDFLKGFIANGHARVGDGGADVLTCGTPHRVGAVRQTREPRGVALLSEGASSLLLGPLQARARTAPPILSIAETR